MKEKKAGQNAYKIGEFCKLLGISPDTLRYYERRKLLKTEKNSSTSYRSFRKEHALQIWDAHMLRRLDMSVEDTRRFHEDGNLEIKLKWLAECENELALTIAALEAKKERVHQLSLLYQSTGKIIGNAPSLGVMEACYAAYVLGEGCTPTETMLERMPQWIAALPFSYVAIGISEKNLHAHDEPLSVHLGLGILRKNTAQVDVKPAKGTVYISGGKALRFVLKTHDVFAITREELAPLFAEAEAQSVRLVGSLAGRVLYTIYEEDHPVSVVGFAIRVEPL